MYTSDDEREPCPELKNCPLCGEPPKSFYYSDYDFGWGIECKNEKCEAYWFESIPVKKWNNRPLEDALKKKNDRLISKLRKLLVASEMYREFDMNSEEDFNELYPSQDGWAHGDVDEHLLRMMDDAREELERK
jgi:hypothetical protein